MSSRKPTGRHNDYFPLGTEAEWDYEQSLYDLSGKAMGLKNRETEKAREAYRIAHAASLRLLTLLEAQHDLPPQNIHRDYFRNTMKEVRMFSGSDPHITESDYAHALSQLTQYAHHACEADEAGMQTYRLKFAAAIRLLLHLEAQHDLAPKNPLRDEFRNTMQQVRAIRGIAGTTQD